MTLLAGIPAPTYETSARAFQPEALGVPGGAPGVPPEASPQNIEIALSLLAQADQGAWHRALAGRSDEDQLLRRSRLTTLLKPLAGRLEEEVKGLIALQESFQQEDAINAEERAIGRREAAKRREQERRLLLNNICYLRLEKAPEDLPADQRQWWQWRNEYRLATFEEAVKRFRRGGRLLEVDEDDRRLRKAPRPVPRRNLRREEATRRADFIRKLAELCETAEEVAAGRKKLPDPELDALIARAEEVISSEPFSRLPFSSPPSHSGPRRNAPRAGARPDKGGRNEGGKVAAARPGGPSVEKRARGEGGLNRGQAMPRSGASPVRGERRRPRAGERFGPSGPRRACEAAPCGLPARGTSAGVSPRAGKGRAC